MDSSNPLPVSPPLPSPPAAPCWSAVLQKKAPPKPQEPISSRVFGNRGSSNSEGISVAVVDANAIIHGDKLVGVADKFVTISEVFDEVKDPVSRQRLALLPLAVETMEPSPESIKKGEIFGLNSWNSLGPSLKNYQIQLINR